MKSKFIKKLCVYALSVTMMFPAASMPVAAATTKTITQSYGTFNLRDTMNYKFARLYEGDTLQLKTTASKSKLNKISGKLTWSSSNPKVASVSANGKVTAKKLKISTPGKLTTTEAETTIVLKKGSVTIAECVVDVIPIQFSTSTRTIKKGKTLKVYVPEYVGCLSSSNSKVVKVDPINHIDNSGKYYITLKGVNKGTVTITLQFNKKDISKGYYISTKTFKFKVNVK